MDTDQLTRRLSEATDGPRLFVDVALRCAAPTSSAVDGLPSEGWPSPHSQLA